MPELLNIIEKLQDTEASLAKLEEAVSDHQESFSLVASKNSLLKRRSELEKQLNKATEINHLDVCHYRVFSEFQERLPVISLAKSLIGFQTLLTVTYDAIIKGPKVKRKLSKEVKEATSLDFGYAYSGSAGFVLTIPNERFLLGESNLDKAIQKIIELTKASATQDFLDLKHNLGIATIRDFSYWIKYHTEFNLGTNIEWRRGKTVKDRIFVQNKEFKKLSGIINQTSEEEKGIEEVPGVLTAANINAHSFRFTADDDRTIHGTMEPALGIPELTLEIPKKYIAKLRYNKTIYFSTEKEDTKYHLLELSPL